MRNPLVLSLCIAALCHSHLQSACRQCFFDPFIAVCSCIVQFIASRGCSVLCHCRADAGLCIGFQTGFISYTRPGKQRNCMFARSERVTYTQRPSTTILSHSCRSSLLALSFTFQHYVHTCVLQNGCSKPAL